MTKKDRAKKLLEQLNSLEAKKSLTLQDEVGSLISRLKDTSGVKTLKAVEKIAAEVEKFKTDFNLVPVMQAIKELELEIQQSEQDLREELNTKLLAIPQTPDLTEEVTILRSQFQAKLEGLGVEGIKADIENFKLQLQTYIDSDIQEDKTEQAELDKRFAKLRTEINSRLTNLGGGQAAPRVQINGTTMSQRFADLNLKAGTNVTITYADNQTTKNVDITLAATGGAGTVRSISTVTVSSVIGTLAGTDQVILANGGVQITLPTAVSDTNLYTIKNIGTSSVLINTTGGQTIDTAPTLIMPVQFTSVDLVSDNSNWNLT